MIPKFYALFTREVKKIDEKSGKPYMAKSSWVVDSIQKLRGNAIKDAEDYAKSENANFEGIYMYKN